jgi:phosphonate transport system ATP-binding protein
MIQVSGVDKIYEDGTHALHDINLHFKEGEFATILGPSGSGKSTLLRCLNGLVEVTKGDIDIYGLSPVRGSERDLLAIRRMMGMIFQEFNLVNRLSAVKNVLSGRLSYKSTLSSVLHYFRKEERILAGECLKRVGLLHKARIRADKLSGGERQRVGIARAMCQKPKVILADEPVSSLDPKSADVVLGYLKKINKEDKITIICTLHIVSLAKNYAERIIGLSDGQIIFDGTPGTFDSSIEKKLYKITA